MHDTENVCSSFIRSVILFAPYLPCSADQKNSDWVEWTQVGGLTLVRISLVEWMSTAFQITEIHLALQHAESFNPEHTLCEWGPLVSYLRNDQVFPVWKLPPSEVTYTFCLAGSLGPHLGICYVEWNWIET